MAPRSESGRRSSPSQWLPRPPAGRGLAVLCFPWAGGGARSFAPWRGMVAADGVVELCPVQLPGRERRIAEPPPPAFDVLLEELVPALAPHCERPFALYGHSAGALLAFAVGAQLERLGLTPLHLVVSGSRPPHVREEQPAMHLLPDAGLLERLVELGATPPGLLADAELLELILPTLRADLRGAETYLVPNPRQLTCPVTAIAASGDSVSVDTVGRWRETTSAAFELVVVAGGHFAAVEAGGGVSAPAVEVIERIATAAR